MTAKQSTSRLTKRRTGRPSSPVPRELLVLSARRVFARAGYAGASLSDIAAEAGITKATLLHHFGDKESLYREVLTDVLGRLGSMIIGGWTGPGDFLSRFDAVGAGVTRFLGTNPGAARLLMEELVRSEGGRLGPAREMVESTVRGLSRLLADAMEGGELPKQDPHQLALSLAGLHLTYFAAAEVSAALLQKDVHAPALIAAREAAVQTQGRALCLAPRTAEARSRR
jgi:TetR/AcrR family transcriptional regulator